MRRLIPTKLPIGNRTGSEYLQVPCKVSNKQRETALADGCRGSQEGTGGIATEGKLSEVHSVFLG